MTGNAKSDLWMQISACMALTDRLAAFGSFPETRFRISKSQSGWSFPFL